MLSVPIPKIRLTINPGPPGLKQLVLKLPEKQLGLKLPEKQLVLKLKDLKPSENTKKPIIQCKIPIEISDVARVRKFTLPYGPILVSFDVAIITLTVCVMAVNTCGRIKIYHWDQIPLLGRAAHGTICKTTGCKRKALYIDGINKVFCSTHRSNGIGTISSYFNATNISCTNIAVLLISTLDSYPDKDILLNGDIVVIETQPRKNPRMQKLSWFIDMYFADRSMVQGGGKIRRIDFFEPKGKMQHWTGPKVVRKHKNAYNHRKYSSEVICQKMLEAGNVEDSAEWLAFYNRISKKDDYADSFNQALTYALSDRYKL